MKKCLLVLALMFLVGQSACDGCSRTVARYTGYSRLCIDGVSYLQFSSGASVEYNANGMIKTCR